MFFHTRCAVANSNRMADEKCHAMVEQATSMMPGRAHRMHFTFLGSPLNLNPNLNLNPLPCLKIKSQIRIKIKKSEKTVQKNEMRPTVQT
jgi:hypothetical protein